MSKYTYSTIICSWSLSLRLFNSLLSSNLLNMVIAILRYDWKWSLRHQWSDPPSHTSLSLWLEYGLLPSLIKVHPSDLNFWIRGKYINNLSFASPLHPLSGTGRMSQGQRSVGVHTPSMHAHALACRTVHEGQRQANMDVNIKFGKGNTVMSNLPFWAY